MSDLGKFIFIGASQILVYMSGWASWGKFLSYTFLSFGSCQIWTQPRWIPKGNLKRLHFIVFNLNIVWQMSDSDEATFGLISNNDIDIKIMYDTGPLVQQVSHWLFCSLFVLQTITSSGRSLQGSWSLHPVNWQNREVQVWQPLPVSYVKSKIFIPKFYTVGRDLPRVLSGTSVDERPSVSNQMQFKLFSWSTWKKI